ncbi:MAG: SDR family NAD(P)-dependent oxidoreductase [Bdellovibrionales bacterium]
MPQKKNMMTEQAFPERWALVTGAARRIGHAIALDLAANGWNIVVHYHASQSEAQALAEQIQDMGRKAALAEINLANLALTEKLIPSLIEEIGPLTALVNNASLFEPDAQDPGGARHRIINYEAPKILSESFAANNAALTSSAIVNLLDSRPDKPSFSNYNASKIALRNLTFAMALREAPRLRVNAVAPGTTLPSARDTEETFAQRIAALPLRAATRPEDVACAVRFLIETPSITGEIIHVDSGSRLLNLAT